jgi:hypothetical protein
MPECLKFVFILKTSVTRLQAQFPADCSHGAKDTPYQIYVLLCVLKISLTLTTQD